MANIQTKIEDLLASRLGLFLRVVAPVIAVVFFATDLQNKVELNMLTVKHNSEILAKDIETIKSEITRIEKNHLSHIQDSIEAINKSIASLTAKEEKTEALLEQHLSR